MLTCQRPPKRKRDAVKIHFGGRQVCDTMTAAGREIYKQRTVDMWNRQKCVCPICKEYIRPEDRSFEHEIPRGMGGANRDDRIWKLDAEGNRIPINFCTHLRCNTERGSKRTI